MKQYFIILILSFLFVPNVFGQTDSNKQVAHWTLDIVRVNDSIFDLNIRVVLKKDWLIYSQYCPVVAGYPFVTVFDYSDFNKMFRVGMQTQEMNTPITSFDSLLNKKVKYFKDTVVFRQRLGLLNKKGECKLKIHFMTYNDKYRIAYPPETISYNLYFDSKRKTILYKKTN